MSLRDINFNGLWFGIKKGDGRQLLYSMLSHSTFRPNMATGTRKVIEAWYNMHPNAKVVEVYRYKTNKEKEKSGFIYCWIIDKEDTLNNILIRQGNFDVEYMKTPRIWDGTNDEEFAYSPGISEITFIIDKKDYDNWLERINILGRKAKEEKLGIWKNRK